MAPVVLSIACLRFLPAFYSHAKVELEIVHGLQRDRLGRAGWLASPLTKTLFI